jgi:hypothetical protein
MSVHHPQPGPAHWIAFWTTLICGGPVIGLFVGLTLHGAAKLFGWVP